MYARNLSRVPREFMRVYLRVLTIVHILGDGSSMAALPVIVLVGRHLHPLQPPTGSRGSERSRSTRHNIGAELDQVLSGKLKSLNGRLGNSWACKDGWGWAQHKKYKSNWYSILVLRRAGGSYGGCKRVFSNGY